ncbi:MAG: tetratricopeptide repeat protein [Planctomycetota bacterium]
MNSNQLPIRRRCPPSVWLGAVLGMLVAVACLTCGYRVVADEPDADQFEDLPQPLVAKTARTEQELDRILATSNYGHARWLLRRDQIAPALRRFQRAYRYDPNAVDLMREVIPLAAKLNRADVVGRYAVLSAEQSKADPATLIRLGALLTEQQEWSGAERLYRRLFEARRDQPADFSGAMVDLELGKLYYLLDRPRDSANAFARLWRALQEPEKHGLDEQLIKLLLGKPAQTYQLMGEAMLEAQRWDEAAELFRQAFPEPKQAALLALPLARVALGKGSPREALRLLSEYTAADIRDGGSEPYDVLAQVFRDLESDPAIARQRLREQLATWHDQFPQNELLTLAYADVLRTERLFRDAQPLYEQLLKKQRASDVIAALVELHIEQKQAVELLKLLAESLARGGTLESIGTSAELFAEYPEIARTLVALARDPANQPVVADPSTAYAAALVAVAIKDLDAADELFTRTIKNGSPAAPGVYLVWGTSMLLAEAPARTARVLREAIDRRISRENEQTFYYYLAGALEMDGKTDEALQAGQAALQAGEKTPRLVSRVAWIPYHAKRYREAEVAYRALLTEYESQPTVPGAVEAVREARLILSNICALTERLPEAEEWLEQVLDENPEDIGASNDLGYLWADQDKHPQRALAMCRRASAAEPKNRSYRDSLGWALYRVGEFAAAVKELEIAVDDEEADGLIWDHLGDACWQARQDDTARRAWQKSSAAYNRDREPEKAKQVSEKSAHPPSR